MPICSTSYLLKALNEERNDHVRKSSDMERYGMQFAYIAIIPFAIIEVIFTQTLKCVTYFARTSNHEYRYFNELAKSSLWGLLWAIDCIFMNLCSKRLYTSERSYVNFISHFSCQTFRARFNQVDANQELTLEPLTVPEPVKKLLEKYEVGDSALEYSVVYEMLYEMLPEVTPDQVQRLPHEIGTLMADWENKNEIVKALRSIVDNYPHRWTPLNKRFITMLVFTKDTILASKNPDDMANFKNQFAGVFRACVNRMTTEMEAVFFQFAAPSLFEKVRGELVERTQRGRLAGANDKFFKLIYHMIPKPTTEECDALIAYVIKEVAGQPRADYLMGFLMELTGVPYETLGVVKQHFLKMLLYTKKAVTDPKLAEKDENVQAVNRTAFITGLLSMHHNVHTDNKTNETLFFRYAAAHLFDQANRERLLYDYTQYRKDLSTYVMQRILTNRDEATNLNYFAYALHKDFGLPEPPLSAVDNSHRNIVSYDCRSAITAGFKKCYLSTHTIYAFFYDIICPKQKEDKNYKRFPLEAFTYWQKNKYFTLAQKGGTLPQGVTRPEDVVLPEEALDEELTGPNPIDVIEFLVEMKMLKDKVQGNR